MKSKLSPPRVLALGFLSLIVVGTGVLLLPISTNEGISLIDALFTATSAVCVTGLIVKDTPVDFTLFGQFAIMLLIQIGGLGYMTSATIIPILVGRKIGLGERVIMKESLNILTVEGVVRFTKTVMKVTILLELVGAVFLTIRFAWDMELLKAAYFGVFHSISAFNNAGFALFSDSLEGYRSDLTVNAVVCLLIILGGIGFFVMSDLYKYYKKEVRRLTLHTKLVLVTTAILIIAGTASFYLFENDELFSGRDFSMKEKVLVSAFQSITARTAGFSTISVSGLTVQTAAMIMFLMFIGGAPGSTAGGIKVTTFSTLVLSLWSTVRGRTDVTAFNRRISESMVFRAFSIASLSSIFVVLVSITLFHLEHSDNIKDYIFEVVSAFGVVGLSTGDGGPRSLSALFSPTGKIIIIMTMFAGRLGPLTLAFAMLKGEKERYRYPEGKVIIG